MLNILLILIFTRPFISSLAFPLLSSIHSITLLIIISLIFIRKPPFQELQKVKYPLIAFFIAIAASILFSLHKTDSLREIFTYLGGPLLFIAIAPLNQEQKTRILRMIILAGLIISILAIYQYFFGFQNLAAYIAKEKITNPFVLDYVSSKRVFLPFVTPNTLAGYLIIILPLVFIMKAPQKWLIALPVICALFFTKSVGAILSLIAVAGLCLALRKNWGKKEFIILAAMLIFITIIFMLRQNQIKEYLSPAFSLSKRLDYWQETFEIIKSHPFKGIGLGNFNLALSRYAHNSYLQIWAEMGLLGIISFIWLLITIIRNNNRNIYLLAAVLVFLIHNCVDFTFFLPEVSFIWWAILGLSYRSSILSDK